MRNLNRVGIGLYSFKYYFKVNVLRFNEIWFRSEVNVRSRFVEFCKIVDGTTHIQLLNGTKPSWQQVIENQNCDDFRLVTVSQWATFFSSSNIGSFFISRKNWGTVPKILRNGDKPHDLINRVILWVTTKWIWLQFRNISPNGCQHVGVWNTESQFSIHVSVVDLSLSPN